MAKWGEGDPRWQVVDREDGTNVNGWHWREKNCLAWSKAKLESLLADKVLSIQSEGTARITALQSCTGDASVSLRKGNKKCAIYDLNLVFAYEGSLLAEAGKTYKGEIKLNEFASANDNDEYEWSITIEGKGKHHDRMKKLILQVMKEDLLSSLTAFAEALAEVEM